MNFKEWDNGITAKTLEQDELELGLRVAAYLSLEEKIRYEVPLERPRPWSPLHPWARWFIDRDVPDGSPDIDHRPGLRQPSQ